MREIVNAESMEVVASSDARRLHQLEDRAVGVRIVLEKGSFGHDIIARNSQMEPHLSRARSFCSPEEAVHPLQLSA